MNIWKNKKGLTLAETLIAVSIFATVAVVAGGIFVSIVHEEKKSTVQSVIYEDLKTILQQITYEIQHGTIDYDEYYSYYVIQEGQIADDVYYGINYGVYGSRFYNPGQSFQPTHTTTKNPIDLGSECSYPTTLAPREKCDVVYTLSGDTNTGQNPYYGTPESANAFCDIQNQGKCNEPIGETNQLFLIDNTGTRKTIISSKLINRNGDDKDDYAVGLVRMNGRDFDQNGVVDTFSCADGFRCFGNASGTGDAGALARNISLPLDKILGKEEMVDVIEDENITVPKKGDLDIEFLDGEGKINPSRSSFVPISPLRSTVKNLKFIINPLEDPYKAYAEKVAQAHPTVTIMMTLGLSEKAKADYPGEFSDISVQTTVAAGVVGRIDSYPPVLEIKGKKADGTWEQSWIYPLSIPLLSPP